MACRRSMTQKKKEGERGNHVWKNREKEGDDTRERTNALRSKPYPHSSINPYTCTFWSRLHDLFLHGSSLWLYNIWNASMPCSYLTALVRIIKVVCFERIILGNFAIFLKTFFKNKSRGIADLWTNEYYFANRSNSEQSKTRRQLKVPMKE